MSPNSSVNGTEGMRGEQLAEVLRAQIEKGELKVGAKLPTQAQLAKKYGVGRGIVRDALSILNGDGLLDNVGKGSSPVVAPRQPADTAEPLPAGVVLADEIIKAFTSATDVTLDAFSLTSETLNDALRDAGREIRRGRLDPPDTITVRLIVPRPGTHLALPKSTTDDADPRPLDRLFRLIDLHTDGTRHALYDLERRVRSVDIEIRTVPITPTHKMYVLNRTELLMGPYVPKVETVRDLDDPDVEMEIVDVRGLDATLFHYSAGPRASRSDRARVAQERAFFDEHWKITSEPYPTPGTAPSSAPRPH